MQKLDLKGIQNIELNILKELNTVSELYGLRLYLCGGTLLGAIRHKGFIPWDDDVDVCMPRPDYDRFIELVKKEHVLPDHLELFSLESGNALYPYAKIMDKRTWIDKIYSEQGEDNGIYIDLLPVDGLPNSKRKVKQIFRKVEFLRKLLMLTIAKENTGTTRLKGWLKAPLKRMSRMIGQEKLCRKIDFLARKYSFETSDYVGIVSWGLYGAAEAMPKSRFCRPSDVIFEQETFRAASCWDIYLKRLYGDYMVMPPEKDRRVHMIDAWVETEEETGNS